MATKKRLASLKAETYLAEIEREREDAKKRSPIRADKESNDQTCLLESYVKLAASRQKVCTTAAAGSRKRQHFRD
ncbi:hypothetical protein M514_05527 [Trichuris suis]|uniref:Uncharacterized protein n=1 Tax=Trichuris suis TaxID=68888 RepID=A0A085M8R5_9BILA|nr:hypothetical protein M513_05527 [Trichuris suis]KFD62608.1 hypothetical protein M514_05527 [Trichuris suis]